MKNKIESLGSYFREFNISEGIAYVLVEFPNKWVIPDSELLYDTFKTKHALDTRGVYFFTEIDNDISLLFDCINFTITFNKDIEEKSSLLKNKIEELKKLFMENELKDLYTLEFKIKKRGNKNNNRKSKDKGLETPEVDENIKETCNIKNNIELGEPDKVSEPPKSVSEEPDSMLNFAEKLCD